jgi:tartrate-resistant acid phosphatase type 5
MASAVALTAALAAAAAAAAPTAGTTTAASPPPALAIPFFGDWGGQGDSPFTRPGELDIATSLDAYMASLPPGTAPAVIGAGDNLYPMGACNDEALPPYNATCPGRDAPGAGTAADPRFNATFESVFTGPALAATPFFVVAGNQDAIGNVSASIAYSAVSTRWRHPGFWYRLTTGPVPPGAGWRPGDAGGAPVNGAVIALGAGPLPGGASVDILLVDVTLCYGVFPPDPIHPALCAGQQAWLESALAASTASFLFVVGHYPVWSGCAHGSTQWAIDTLLPAMAAANVTAYLSGHDHCGEVIAPPDAASAGRDMVFVVAGTGEGCCYGEPNVDALPTGSLKYLLSAAYNAANVSAGFGVLRIDAPAQAGAPEPAGGRRAAAVPPPPAVLSFEYRAADGAATLLYTSPRLLPRTPVMGPDGRVVAMAAPDYAAAGVPRPSAAAPAGNYSSTASAPVAAA